MQAALECFQKKGYHNTSMEDIVKQSGVSKGGIYWYFKSKEDIFVYMIEKWTNDWLHEVNKELAKLTDVKSKLMKYGKLYCKSIDLPLIRLLPEVWSANISKENNKRLKYCFKADRHLLVGIFNEAALQGEIVDTDADVLAHLLISMLDGIMLYRLTIKNGDDLQELVSRGLDIFLRGIKWQGGMEEC